MQTDFSNIIKYFPQKKLVSIYTENKEVLLHSDIVVIDDWIVFQYISTFNNEKEYVVRTTAFDFIECSRMLNNICNRPLCLYIHFIDFDTIRKKEKDIIQNVTDRFSTNKLRIIVLNKFMGLS